MFDINKSKQSKNIKKLILKEKKNKVKFTLDAIAS
jgi:hypothetical protein